MAELVDARDLKSLGPSGCAGSIPAPGTITAKGLAIFGEPFFSAKITDVTFLYVFRPSKEVNNE